jgi:hypothetical protein
MHIIEAFKNLGINSLNGRDELANVTNIEQHFSGGGDVSTGSIVVLHGGGARIGARFKVCRHSQKTSPC